MFGTDKRITSEPLGTRVADAVREAIICGQLRQGEAVTADGLAAAFSVSAMPAREALLILSHEGMVEAVPKRGYRIARMVRQDVEDIYWVHSMLAASLASRACERRTGEFLAELEENLARSRAAFEAHDLQTLGDLERAFHAVINAAADSPKISALLTTTARLIPQSFNRRLHEMEAWERVCLDEHAQLLDAFRRGDPAAAEATAVKHVANTRDAMIECLSSAGYWDHEDASD